MNESGPSLRAELRASPTYAIALVALMAAVLLLVSGGISDPWAFRLQAVGVLLGALSGLAWLLERWRTWVGRWFITAVLVAIVAVADVWLGVPGVLVLAAIPTAMAAALINLTAAAATAAAQTALLVLLAGAGRAPEDWVSVGVALTATWLMLGVMGIVYGPVYQMARWLDEYFERGRSLLTEARDRKAELEQAMDRLAHANRQLALANERVAALRRIAEEAQKTKTAFVANVSHEFRTPLNMIIGLVDLMVESPQIYAVALSPKMREDLEVVHRNCEHLSNMVNDVLDLTQVEAGRLALYREHVDLKAIIENSVATVQPLLDKKRLSVQVLVPDTLDQVYCDRTRIQQVILNLVSNAARFTERGGMTLEVAQRGHDVLVSVTDTGPGITPEDAERIFDPFVQGSGDLWRDRKGSGLGLSISRQFVRLHGGQMWLKSELGVGTSFYFTLPVSPPAGHTAEPGHQIREDWVWREHSFGASQSAYSDELLKPRVMVFDPDGTLDAALAHYSQEVEFVCTPELEVALHELEQSPAHALVLNTASPEAIWPLIDSVRKRAPTTPVVGCSVPPTVQRAMAAGAAGHLIKPVTRADLARAIESVDRPVKRVLVVDDDPSVLRLFSRMLHVCDPSLEVITAGSAGDALSTMRSSQPDLVLLDIVMPDVDGWRLLELMAEDAGIGAIPTYFVSAQDPASQPPTSQFVLVSIDGGLPLGKLLRSALTVSALLLRPEGAPSPAPQ